MTPVFQTITDHNPQEGRYGNCTQACVASILDMPLEQVPHFCFELPEGTDGGIEETRRINEWLKPMGKVLVEFAVSADGMPSWIADWQNRGVEFYHLLSGTSVRGNQHCTVGLNGKVVHDPHPAGGNLAPIENGTFGIGIITNLVPTPPENAK